MSRLPELAYHFATEAQWRAGVRDDLQGGRWLDPRPGFASSPAGAGFRPGRRVAR